MPVVDQHFDVPESDGDINRITPSDVACKCLVDSIVASNVFCGLVHKELALVVFQELGKGDIQSIVVSEVENADAAPVLFGCGVIVGQEVEVRSGLYDRDGTFL